MARTVKLPFNGFKICDAAYIQTQQSACGLTERTDSCRTACRATGRVELRNRGGDEKCEGQSNKGMAKSGRWRFVTGDLELRVHSLIRYLRRFSAREPCDVRAVCAGQCRAQTLNCTDANLTTTHP
eukprot:6104621-Pleurochrysis_carterae.AAC.3